MLQNRLGTSGGNSGHSIIVTSSTSNTAEVVMNGPKRIKIEPTTIDDQTQNNSSRPSNQHNPNPYNLNSYNMNTYMVCSLGKIMS